MKLKNEQARSYDQSLRSYFNVLQIREKAGALPEQFNPTMAQFIEELNQLIAHDKSVELARAA